VDSERELFLPADLHSIFAPEGPITIHAKRPQGDLGKIPQGSIVGYVSRHDHARKLVLSRRHQGRSLGRFILFRVRPGADRGALLTGADLEHVFPEEEEEDDEGGPRPRPLAWELKHGEWVPKNVLQLKELTILEPGQTYTTMEGRRQVAVKYH
jgi:hypothetical protein